MADRVDGAWRHTSYADALAQGAPHRQALLNRNLSAERPIVDPLGQRSRTSMAGARRHARRRSGVADLAGLFADLERLRQSQAHLRQDSRRAWCSSTTAPRSRARSRRSCRPTSRSSSCAIRRRTGARRCSRSFSRRSRPTRSIDAFAKVGPDTIAKFMFTSGSTGQPKGVINTQRMLCSNQAMILAALAYFEDEPPIVLDWAPWHHTAGGNHDVNLVLYNGGTFYIDDGKPMPGAIEATVRNLRDVSPTWYFNVPKGFEALLPYLQNDESLRQSFFKRPQGAVVRRRRRLAIRQRRIHAARVRDHRRTHPVPHRPRLDRDRALRHRPHLGERARGQCRPARPRRRGEAGAERRQARAAAARPEHPARLLARSGADEERLRRGRLLPHRRRRRVRRSERSGQGPAVRRAHRRGLQALDRHLGVDRPAARAHHRLLLALCARRGADRARPRSISAH